MKFTIKKLLLITFFAFTMNGCKDEKEYLNPYSGGKERLGVAFNTEISPSPAEGDVSTLVEFAVSGADKYPRTEMSFTFNGVPAEVVDVTSNSVKVKVPANASSGLVSLQVQDQVFVGPRFSVLGKIGFDINLQETKGTTGPIYDYLTISNDRVILVGAFSKYANRPMMNGIVRIREDGFIDNTFRQNGGATGSIFSIVSGGSKLFIGGSFKGYNYNVGGTSTMSNIYSITRLQEDGSLDSSFAYTYNKRKIAVPSFMGGVNSAISKIYSNNNKIVAVGGFRWYFKPIYNKPSSPYQVGNQTVRFDTTFIDTVEAPQVLRLDQDGNLDKTYRFDLDKNQGLPAGNGSIIASCMHTDGKLLLAGNFTKFDEVAAGRIIRLKADGTIDPSFSANANKAITAVDFDESSQKYLVCGIFNSFNGEPASGLVRLNADGSTDKSFIAKAFAGGYPDFVKRLSNGMILVSGSFNGYGGIRRLPIMFLNANGELAQGYNAMGELNGSLEKVIEGTDSQGRLTLTLLGSFSQLNGTYVNNMTRIVLNP